MLKVTQNHQADAVLQLPLVVSWDLDETGVHPVVLQGDPSQLQVGLSSGDVLPQSHTVHVLRGDVYKARGVVDQDYFLPSNSSRVEWADDEENKNTFYLYSPYLYGKGF